jgi:hypothetical protein
MRARGGGGYHDSKLENEPVIFGKKCGCRSALVCPAWALPGGAFGAPPQAGYCTSHGLEAFGGSVSQGSRVTAQADGSRNTGTSDWAAT